MISKLLLLCILLLTSFLSADIIFDNAQQKVMNSKLIKKDDVKVLTKTEIDILLNSVYAKHGKTFNNMNLNYYFLNKSWYKTSSTYSDTKLNFTDKININSLKSYLRIAKNWRENQVTYNSGRKTVIPDSKDEDQVEEVVVGNQMNSESLMEQTTVVKQFDTKISISKDDNKVGFFQLFKGTKILNLKTVYEPGERIIFSAKFPAVNTKKCWFGIIPSNIEHGDDNINDKNDISYVWSRDKKNNKYTLYAPFVPDYYDIRLSKKGENSRELGYFTFKVKSIAGNAPKLMLEKKTFRAREEIVLRFIAADNFEEDAWIGIVKSKFKHGSEKLNDAHDISYKHLKMRDAGILYFRAPSSAGRYDFRMNTTDKNGKEVAYISFKVVK